MAMVASPPLPARPRRPRYPRRLLDALRWVEVPECGCRLTMLPVCTRWGGCERYRARERCGCARWPGEPCVHLTERMSRLRIACGFQVLFQIAGMPMAEETGKSPEELWAEWLWLVRERDYADRPPPACGARAVTHEARVELMRLRQALGLGLWHPGDVRWLGEQRMDVEVEQQARTRVDFLRVLRRRERQEARRNNG